MIFFCQEWEHSPVDQVGTITLFVAYSVAMFAHPPSTFGQEAACSRADPSPGFTAKIVISTPRLPLPTSGYVS